MEEQKLEEGKKRKTVTEAAAKVASMVKRR
jgi:hypothetical protein